MLKNWRQSLQKNQQHNKVILCTCQQITFDTYTFYYLYFCNFFFCYLYCYYLLDLVDYDDVYKPDNDDVDHHYLYVWTWGERGIVHKIEIKWNCLYRSESRIALFITHCVKYSTPSHRSKYYCCLFFFCYIWLFVCPSFRPFVLVYLLYWNRRCSCFLLIWHSARSSTPNEIFMFFLMFLLSFFWI